MTYEEIKTIVNWLANPENMEKLSVEDQLAIYEAHVRFCEALKSIVMKQLCEEESSQTFLFKL